MAGRGNDAEDAAFGEAFQRLPDGRYANNLDRRVLEMITSLGLQLAAALDGDDAVLRRLFPTAYPDDPEREAGYQILARSELVEQRRAAVQTTLATIDHSSLDEAELSDWLAVTNDLRLVLGTQLDVSEDGDEYDPASPEADVWALYHLLGSVAWVMVDALSSGLADTPTPE